MEKEQSNLPSTGLIINGAVLVKHLCHVHNKSQTIQFWILEAVLLWKTICRCVQSHPEDRGDFEQGSTEHISECNNHLELSVYNMWCFSMVLTNPHMKPIIEFIIMKIFMKIVKICPKSPRFTVIDIYIAHIAEASKRLETEGRVEMTWDDVNYIRPKKKIVMLPSPDQNLKIGSVGRDFVLFVFFCFVFCFPIFVLKFLNGENSGGMQSKRIYKSCKCFFKPLNKNFSKFFAQIWH